MQRYQGNNPALKAQDRYAWACMNFDRSLERYLSYRAAYGREDRVTQTALSVLQGAKRIRQQRWAAWMAYSAPR